MLIQLLCRWSGGIVGEGDEWGILSRSSRLRKVGGVVDF
jgi:hypothetical protein